MTPINWGIRYVLQTVTAQRREFYRTAVYCDNDFHENETYLYRGNKLKIMREADYLAIVEARRRESRFHSYYPGRYTREFFPVLARELARTDHSPRKRFYEKEAHAFLNALYHSETPLHDIDIVVIEIDGYATDNPGFLNAVKDRIENEPADHARRFRSLTIVDLSKVITKAHYFPYDDHLNASGHAVVAKLLSSVLSDEHPEPH